MRPRDNPFNINRRVERLRVRPPAGGWPALLDRLEQLHYQAAITGPHGHGKTTLLGEFVKRLAQSGRSEICHLRLTVQQPRLSGTQWASLRKTSRNTLVCLDGAEQLGILYWLRVRRLARRGRGFLITTHLPGRLPTLTECHSTPTLLAALIDDLLADTKIRLPHDIEALHERHQGNIRDALDELYDYCQTL